MLSANNHWLGMKVWRLRDVCASYPHPLMSFFSKIGDKIEEGFVRTRDQAVGVLKPNRACALV